MVVPVVELPPDPVEAVAVVVLVAELIVVATLLVGPLAPAVVVVEFNPVVVAVELVTPVELVTLADTGPPELFAPFTPEVVVEPPDVARVPLVISGVAALSSEQALAPKKANARKGPRSAISVHRALGLSIWFTRLKGLQHACSSSNARSCPAT